MGIFNTVICRYNEIATKGNNRSMFENRLVENIKIACSSVCSVKISRIRGRIFFHKDDKSVFSDAETEGLTANLKRCFGLDSFSFCLEDEPTLEKVKEMVRNRAS